MRQDAACLRLGVPYTARRMVPKYFSALTGIRAIAAYLVFLHHFNPFPAGFFHDLVHQFHIGVTIFFVLSGFLIGYRYQGQALRIGPYFINRLARIYPMYWLLTTFAFAYWALKGRGFDLGLYAANVTFVRGFSDATKFTGIAQGWSLTVEEVFYFSAPLLFWIIAKWRGWWVGLPAVLFGIGLLLIAACRGVAFENLPFMAGYTFFGRATEFVAGMGLAAAVKRWPKRTVRGATWIGFANIGLVLVAMALCPGAGVVLNNVALPILGVCPLFFGLLTEETVIRRVLAHPLSVLLGKSSYVFYLIHVGVWMDVVQGRVGSYVLAFLVLNVIAVALFRYVEEPLNLWIRRALGRSPVQKP